jgi:CYTH domain-containing protein
MLEIERKFLVSDLEFLTHLKANRIIQGYLTTDPERTVRVRIKGVKAYITIKGNSNESGLTRFEWEKEISVVEAEELLELALPGVIDKKRYELMHGNKLWEVDVFLGNNEGLVLAEVELTHENEHVTLPDWVSAEVTGDPRYYNSYLSNKPYKQW